MCIFVLSIIIITVFTVALNVLLNVFLVTLASPLNGVAVELWLVFLQKLSFYLLVC